MKVKAKMIKLDRNNNLYSMTANFMLDDYHLFNHNVSEIEIDIPTLSNLSKFSISELESELRSRFENQKSVICDVCGRKIHIQTLQQDKVFYNNKEVAYCEKCKVYTTFKEI
jgi:hypothetical protein